MKMQYQVSWSVSLTKLIKWINKILTFPINARFMDGYILDKLTKCEKNNESTKKYFHYLSFFCLFTFFLFFSAALCNIGLKSAVFNKRV